MLAGVCSLPLAPIFSGCSKTNAVAAEDFLPSSIAWIHLSTSSLALSTLFFCAPLSHGKPVGMLRRPDMRWV